MKVTIVGAGNVGAVTAQRIMTYQLANEVVIVDVVEGMAQGKALDIYESAPLVRSDCRIIGTSGYDETAGSDVVVITAGISRRPGMTRDDLLAKNAGIVQGVTREICKRSPECILIIVSSPLEEMTYVALQASGFDPGRVIGMAGALDASRMRSFIAMALDVAVEDVEVMVMGGHGNALMPLMRHATVAGIPVTQLLGADKIQAIVERTRNAGTEIIDLLKTSSAFYAPSAAVSSMIEAITRDKPRILPCAVRLNGQYGLGDVVMGVPVKLGRAGVREIIELELLEEEQAMLRSVSQMIRENIAKLSV